jgi:hypothetical protein
MAKVAVVDINYFMGHNSVIVDSWDNYFMVHNSVVVVDSFMGHNSVVVVVDS